MAKSYLSSFRQLMPSNKLSQEESVSWLKRHHRRHRDQNASDPGKYLDRFSVKPHQINQRYVAHEDVYCQDLDASLIFSPSKQGDISYKSQFYSNHVKGVMQDFYPSTATLPDHIVHTSCTGYVSPSAPQVHVGRLQANTKITHAYHMGCYAAMPAIRMSVGFLAAGHDQSVDVVHTELCSLHMNPTIHSPEQLVIQTLFADGFIKYRLTPHLFVKPGFELLAQLEQVIPNTVNEMKWELEAWGFAMTLSKTVPAKILEHVGFSLEKLAQSENLDVRFLKSRAYFAIHPGGPKIISSIVDHWDLREDQVQASQKVLYSRGNMSSATLPHVWHEMLNSDIEDGSYVVSFAFGPGLTIFASLFRLHRGQ